MQDDLSYITVLYPAQIQLLLSCHKRSMQGKRFGCEPGQQAEALTGYRSAMLLEVVMSQCVQFIRSYYPSLDAASVTTEQLQANRQVRQVLARWLGIERNCQVDQSFPSVRFSVCLHA